MLAVADPASWRTHAEVPVPTAYHSFGGWKSSLFSDLHMHGMDGIRFHTQLKTVTARWPASDPVEGFAFSGSGR